MLNNNFISQKQLFVLLVLFQLGSALVIPLGLDANQDAWIAILLGMAGGILLSIIYTYIYMKNGTLPSFKTIMVNCFGKHLGYILTFLYILNFMQAPVRILTDFRMLLTVTVLHDTPAVVMTILLLLPIVYGCYLGAEVIARSGEMFFILVILSLLSIYILVFTVKLVNISNLKPVLENGIGPVLKSSFPLLVLVPFGETIVFINLFSKVNAQKSIGRCFALSMLVSGVILSFTIAINISVISVNDMKPSTFPMLLAVSLIKIGTFLERFDAVAVILLMVGGFIKILIYFYTSVEMFMDLFNLPPPKRVFIIIFFGGILLIMSNFPRISIVQHYFLGLKLLVNFIPIPFTMVIPIIFGIITFFKTTKLLGKLIKRN